MSNVPVTLATQVKEVVVPLWPQRISRNLEHVCTPEPQHCTIYSHLINEIYLARSVDVIRGAGIWDGSALQTSRGWPSFDSSWRPTIRRDPSLLKYGGAYIVGLVRIPTLVSTSRPPCGSCTKAVDTYEVMSHPCRGATCKSGMNSFIQ